YQQQDGNQENITVMVTICTDGETIPPLVIYKVNKILETTSTSPCHSIAHSKKGWTDGVIGWLWIEDFDKQTCIKANGRTHLLLVDGHNSHYTLEFLNYAQEHNIQILCYPSHLTLV
ncbi:hypothetical protein PISMIDRAFT_38990, partial [Pisolithus microcarpus 441]